MTKPEVLFVCVHNAGRSQMAAALLTHHALGRVLVHSAGSLPADRLNPAAVEALAEFGLDITRETPKKLTDEHVREADVVITMGCGDTCPVFPGKRYLDWQLPDPAGRALADVRPIRDEIDRRVRDLLSELLDHDPDDPAGSGVRPTIGAPEQRGPENMSEEKRDFNQQIADEFRANGGVVGGPFAGRDLLLLTTTGAKSGQERLSPLVYTRDGDRLVVAASYGGAPKNPAWFHNLVADPKVTVEVGTEKFEATASVVADREERDRLYAGMVAHAAGFAEYEQKTDRLIPIVVLER